MEQLLRAVTQRFHAVSNGFADLFDGLSDVVRGKGLRIDVDAGFRGGGFGAAFGVAHKGKVVGVDAGVGQTRPELRKRGMFFIIFKPTGRGCFITLVYRNFDPAGNPGPLLLCKPE